MVVGEKSCFSFFCFFSIGLLFVFLDPQKGKNSWASQLNAELPLSAWWGQSSRLRDSGISTSIWHSELWFSTEYPQIDLRKSSLELHFQTYLHFVYQRLPRPSRWRVLSFTFLWVEAWFWTVKFYKLHRSEGVGFLQDHPEWKRKCYKTLRTSSFQNNS